MRSRSSVVAPARSPWSRSACMRKLIVRLTLPARLNAVHVQDFPARFRGLGRGNDILRRAHDVLATLFGEAMQPRPTATNPARALRRHCPLCPAAVSAASGGHSCLYVAVPVVLQLHSQDPREIVTCSTTPARLDAKPQMGEECPALLPAPGQCSTGCVRADACAASCDSVHKSGRRGAARIPSRPPCSRARCRSPRPPCRRVD